MSDKIIEAAGGVARIQRALGKRAITSRAINFWRYKGIPEARMPLISRLTGQSIRSLKLSKAALKRAAR